MAASRWTLTATFGLMLLLALSMGRPQEPLHRWHFVPETASAGFASGAGSAPAKRSADAAFGPLDVGGGLLIDGPEDVLRVADRQEQMRGHLPVEALTLSAWVAIERTQRWGGIVSCVQDNGDAEKGLLLGFEEDRFSFALATSGADDGNGKLTYLTGGTPVKLGRWHHVVATYDGTTMRLFVDGELDAESLEQSGSVLYDPSAPLVLGSYRDQNEDYPMDGRILRASIYAQAHDAAWVRQDFDQHRLLTDLAPWTNLPFGFLVAPYLTWPTENAMSVSFESTFPSQAEVRYWREGAAEEEALLLTSSQGLHHEFRLEGLDSGAKYFYRAHLRGALGDTAVSDLLSFRTAVAPDRAFTFAVIGDTQTNGQVAKRVSDLAWMHRPNLVVHAGDLVDAGTNKRDWTDVFFPSMQPLIGRVPLMPVLGNHEQDAELYYRYMSLPDPERWYAFTFGDAEFFMIDGNRSLADQSAQLNWLEQALEASDARWRFAVLHQPPYTSDSNDYGDTLVGPSQRGDPNARNIVRLLEDHGVDLCFSGHVHDYERTFPIRRGRVTPYRDGGIVYVTAAGGGGPLEDFDPTNTWFGHKKARYHHFVYVAVHGDHLELQAIDEEGRLFDTLTLTKRP